MARYCSICNRAEHHDPKCPEMFFKRSDYSGEPDYSKPRGVPQGMPPPGPLRKPRPVRRG